MAATPDLDQHVPSESVDEGETLPPAPGLLGLPPHVIWLILDELDPVAFVCTFLVSSAINGLAWTTRGHSVKMILSDPGSPLP